MKKMLGLIALVIIVIVLFSAWKIFGPAIKKPEGNFFYIKTGAVYNDVITELENKNVINGKMWFNLVARSLKYTVVKPGKYEVTKGMSLFNLVRMLKNGRQTPVDLIIIKFRTKEEFAHRIGKEFETDSLQMISFLNNNDSLRHYDLDTNTWVCAIIPNTYSYFWNSTPTRIFTKLYSASKKFWTTDKLEKLKTNDLSPEQAYTIASIVEEETNFKTDKENISSVYINRLHKNMPLQADPTIKFAMKNFELKRIYEKYLATISPYNTYINKGLPPGPICTPSIETLESVINAPKTDYIYFVASSNLDGSSVFSSAYNEHAKNARLYQQALDKQDSIRRARQSN